MQEADSVRSTPPLNSSSIQAGNPPLEACGESVDSFSHQPAIGQPEDQNRASESGKRSDGLSRRNMLCAMAVLPVGLPVPVVATPVGRLWFEVDDEDPAFALIAAKRVAGVVHCEAIDAQDAADTRYGYDSQEAWDASEVCAAAGHDVNVADWNLARTPPTTLAGVEAVLRFANDIEDSGMEWPSTDTVGSEGWHYQLRATMARAIEAIIRQHLVSATV
jgi:hypothetical protein